MNIPNPIAQKAWARALFTQEGFKVFSVRHDKHGVVVVLVDGIHRGREQEIDDLIFSLSRGVGEQRLKVSARCTFTY